MRQQRAQSDRHYEAKFHEEVPHVLLGWGAQQLVQGTQEVGEEGQEFAIQAFMRSTADRAEEGAQEE